jgi:anti-sigma factor RsiW
MNIVNFGRPECNKTRGYLDYYMNNELSVESSHAVQQHLDSCPECSADLAGRLRIKEAVKRSVGQIDAPGYLEARVRARLREQSTPSLFRDWAMPVAVAATVVLAVVLGWRAFDHKTEIWETAKADQENYIESLFHAVPRVIQIGLGDHAHCAYYRKFPNPPQTFAEMAGKLGPNFRELVPLVKQKVPDSFHVAVGHQCKYRERQFVHLALRRENELLSIIITKREPGESFQTGDLKPVLEAAGVPVYAALADQFEIAGLETGQYLAYVISNMPRDENLRIAQALTPPLTEFLSAIQG